MSDDDLQTRLDSLSVSEMRRRVDLAVGYVREMRRSIAVEVGMQLEDAPGRLPPQDPEQGRRVLQELIEMLPVLRRPLTPEEKAKLKPVSEKQNEQMKEVLEELANADPDEFDAMMEEGDTEIRHATVLKMREDMQKTEMLKEVEVEARLLAAELHEYQERLQSSLNTLAASMIKGKGPPS